MRVERGWRYVDGVDGGGVVVSLPQLLVASGCRTRRSCWQNMGHGHANIRYAGAATECYCSP